MPGVYKEIDGKIVPYIFGRIIFTIFVTKKGQLSFSGSKLLDGKFVEGQAISQRKT